MDAIFDDVVKLAEQLNTEQQNRLIYRLRVKQLQLYVRQDIQPRLSPSFVIATEENAVAFLTREEPLRQVEKLRQLPVNPEDSLFGKYAKPDLPEFDEELFYAELHAIATEWEQELDEFFADNA